MINDVTSKGDFGAQHILLLEPKRLIPIMLHAMSSQNLLQLRIIRGLQEPERLELPLPQLTLPNEQTLVIDRRLRDLCTIKPCVVGPIDSTEHEFLVLVDGFVSTFDEDDREGRVHEHNSCQPQLCGVLVDLELFLWVRQIVDPMTRMVR